MKVQWDWDLGGTQAGGEDNDRVELFSIEFMAYTDLVVGVSLGGGGESPAAMNSMPTTMTLPMETPSALSL